MDFTLNRYKELLVALKSTGYRFLTFEEFMADRASGRVVLRHDVDKMAQNAIAVAKIESALNIRASYHFRARKGSFDSQAIKEIISLGHEAAYHYEDTDVAAKMKGEKEVTLSQREHVIYERAYSMFRINLERLREYYPVKVISMHGSPLSRYDNREMWRFYDYHKDGIICEPYFDIDYSATLYLTDTGRRWDGERTNLRDKATFSRDEETGDDLVDNRWAVNPVKGSAMNMTSESLSFQSAFSFRTTRDIIKALATGSLPDSMIINTHPQRWSQRYILWLRELIGQNLKNGVKYFLSHLR